MGLVQVGIGLRPSRLDLKGGGSGIPLLVAVTSWQLLKCVAIFNPMLVVFAGGGGGGEFGQGMHGQPKHMTGFSLCQID